MDKIDKDILTERLKRLSERADKASERFDGIRDQVTTLDKEVALLEQGMGSIRNDLGEHHIRIDDLEEKLSDLEGKLNNIIGGEQERDRIRKVESLNIQQSSQRTSSLSLKVAIILGILTTLLTIYGIYVSSKHTELEKKIENFKMIEK